MRSLFTFLAAASLILSAGCNSDGNRTEADKESRDSLSARIQPGSGRAAPGTEEVRKLVTEWDSAYNAHDADLLASLYSDTVEISGQRLSRAQLTDRIKDQFRKDPDYRQQLAAKPGVVVQGPEIMRATVNRKFQTGESKGVMLWVAKTGEGWKIIAETDPVTHHRSRMEKLKPIKPEEVSSCEEAAEAVVRSSPTLRSLMLRPMTELKLHQRPGDAGNTTGYYIFRVYGKRPEGGEETYRYYQVDRVSGKLSQYTTPGQKPMAAPANPRLEEMVVKMCK